MVDDFLEYFIGESDEASIDDLFALVLGVGDIVIELNYLFE